MAQEGRRKWFISFLPVSKGDTQCLSTGRGAWPPRPRSELSYTHVDKCGLIHFDNGLNNCFCLSPLLIEGFQMKCGHLLQKYLPSVTNINRQNKQISAGCFIDIHITQTQTHTKSSPVQTNTRQISQRGWLKMLIASKNSSIVAWEHMENKRLVLPQYSTCKAEKKLMTH